jgi:transcriptional regulator with XRE-family HTH domain
MEMNNSRDGNRLKQIGEKIREVRERLKLSQDEVVFRCDVTKGNLSNIENGNKDFYFTTFLEIAKGLGVEPKELLDF